MLPSSDDIPSLAISRPTLGNFNRGQVGPEVTRELVDRETFAIRSLPVVVSSEIVHGRKAGHTLMLMLVEALVAVLSRC